MRRLRTKNAPYISILSIGVDEAEPTVLQLSCGIITRQIRARFAAIETIQLTSSRREFRLDSFDATGVYLGPLVRQQLLFGSELKRSLMRMDSDIGIRLFSILNPSDCLRKDVSLEILAARRKAA